jgi:polar amino acid transport system substrate-binding protein
VKTGRVRGYSIRVLDAIMARHRIRYAIRLLPWTRCLAELKDGSRTQMSLDMTINDERSAVYHMTRPYYTTSGHYFYSRRSFPAGLRVERLEDIATFSVCGLKGYNYDKLKLRYVDKGAQDYRALIAKLHAKRCDIFVEQYEALAGFGAIGMPLLDDPDLGHGAVPGIPPVAFSMAVSRRFRHAEALHRLLERELAQMDSSGELKRLWKLETAK